VFFAQSLLFPIGLVCESAAMSWLAYLLVIQRSTAGLSWYLTIIEELKKQGIILLLSGFLWGQLSLVSLFMNLIINPLFTPILVASLFLLFAFFFPPIFSTLTTQVIMSSLEIICWLDRRISTYCPWQYWEHLPSFPRWLLLVASILCLMQFFSRERSAHRNL
jgi:hypothetical protein